MKLQTLTPAPPRDASCAPYSASPPVPVNAQRILVADDNEGVRCVLSTFLARAGFDVNAASDGEEAWDELHREHYDLLVTDNEMPRLAGIKLIERIREAGMSLPVIIASGSLPVESVRDRPQLEIAAILPKPFGITKLLDTVRQTLQTSQGTLPEITRLPNNPLHPPTNALLPPAESNMMPTLPSPTKACREIKPGFLPHRATLQPQVSKTAHNHVLIVDDDSLVRGSLAAVLESEGYVVDEASDGREAVARAVARAPDLVLLDLNMPRWDGWTAFSQLDRVTPLLPVIVITARPNQYDKAVRLGVDAFMEKPLNIPILVRAIKRLTSEDENRHVRRITNRAFVTRLLVNTDS